MRLFRNWTFALSLGCVVSLVGSAQTLTPPGATAGTGSQQKQSSLFGYAFQQINPTDKDYGSDLSSKGEAFTRATLDDTYFWSNCATLLMLAGVTGFCFFHLRGSDKKERIAAALIAQMWNGRVSDKIEIERRTREYNALVEKHDAVVEQSLSPGAPPAPVRQRRMTVEPRIELQPETMQEIPAERPIPANDSDRRPEILEVVTAASNPVADSPSTKPAPASPKDFIKKAAAKQASTDVPVEAEALVPAQAQEEKVTPSAPATAAQAGNTQESLELARLSQENIRLKSQVDAHRNTERNLKERLTKLQQYREISEKEQPVS